MTTHNGEEWSRVGNHCYRFEAPDIMHTRIIGDLTLAEIEEILAVHEAFPSSKAGFFALIDISEAGRPNLGILKSPEILKQMQSYRAFIYYRAQFRHRTVIEIVQKVSRTLALSLSSMPLVAFATEPEARAWIDEYRPRTNV